MIVLKHFSNKFTSFNDYLKSNSTIKKFICFCTNHSNMITKQFKMMKSCVIQYLRNVFMTITKPQKYVHIMLNLLYNEIHLSFSYVKVLKVVA